MAKYFFDSSALTKRYKTERGSDYVNNLFVGNHDLFYLNLAIVETRKVFYRLRFYPSLTEGDIQTSEEEFNQVQAQFAADLQQMRRLDFTEEMIARTEDILKEHWLNSSFDLAHLSAYLITREEYPNIILVVSDGNLVNIARTIIGNNDEVINPEEQT